VREKLPDFYFDGTQFNREDTRNMGKLTMLLFGAVVKRMALASCILLLMLIVMSQFNLAAANAIPYPTEPNQEFPTLEINSPKNGEVFTATNVEINFTVTKPDSWNFYWLTTMPVIGTYSVFTYLDGNLHGKYPLEDPGSIGFPTADYSVFLRLTSGTHRVKIDVEAFTYYDDPDPEHGDYLTYSKNITETIYFTVNADLPTSAPSPTPSPSPESTPETEPFPTTLVVGVTVTIVPVVIVGLLIYFKKLKHKPEITNRLK
jgi:hypothetical protein